MNEKERGKGGWGGGLRQNQREKKESKGMIDDKTFLNDVRKKKEIEECALGGGGGGGGRGGGGEGRKERKNKKRKIT